MKKFWYVWFVLLAINVANADIWINEIAWSGTPNSSNDEWIELYNSGAEKVILDDWKVRSEDGAPDILLEGEIESEGYFLLERTDDTSVSNIIADQIYTGSLSNDGEELVLSNAEGEEIHRTPMGKWVAGSSSPERRSMSWINGEWETYLGDGVNGIYGTPRSSNIVNESVGFVSANPSKVVISEIAPVSCGEEEWLEFEIWSPEKAIDITNWKFRSGNNEKSFEHLINSSFSCTGGSSLADSETGLAEDGSVGAEELGGSGNFFSAEELVFLVDDADFPLRFAAIPSPISLPDGGGNLEILDENGEVLASVIWDETGSGEKDGIKWCEIWELENERLWPLISWEDNFTHSRGNENEKAPVFPEELIFEIVEIAPDRSDKIDYIELLIREIREDTKMPNWSLKHNGTVLFEGGGEELKAGDRITLMLNSEKIADSPERWINQSTADEIGKVKIWESSTRNGLNGSSGTLELSVWDGTSWEKSADFVCWAEDELSEAEKNRLEKYVPDDWSGSCVDTKENINNESIARQVMSNDSNTANDFWRHFNGSPGEENWEVNNPPIAKIMVQGGRRVYETSLNLTGYDKDNPESTSSDGDGYHDLNLWLWEIDGKSCGNYAEDGWEWSATRKGTASCEEESTKSNPGLIYFDFGKSEKFNASLTVNDYSNASSTVEETLTRDPFNVGGSGGNAFEASIEKWMTKEMNKTPSSMSKRAKQGETESDTFFDDFIKNADWGEIANYAAPVKKQTMQNKPILFARDRVTNVDKSRLRKNIGLVLLY